MTVGFKTIAIVFYVLAAASFAYIVFGMYKHYSLLGSSEAARLDILMYSRFAFPAVIYHLFNPAFLCLCGLLSHTTGKLLSLIDFGAGRVDQ